VHYIFDDPACIISRSGISTTASSSSSSLADGCSGSSSFVAWKKHVISFCHAGISLGCTGFPPPEYLSKANEMILCNNGKFVDKTTKPLGNHHLHTAPYTIGGVRIVRNTCTIIIIIIIITRQKRESAITFGCGRRRR